VDFAMRCPVSCKLNNLQEVLRINENESGKLQKYFERTRDGKQILRDVMQHYIPDNVTQAVKQGFTAPDASWFKGDSIDFVRRKLFNKRARIYEILDNESVALLIEEHLSGKQNRRLFIWSLLNVEAWMEGFL
jgi:asparagine synthase (glutamine-hydrolysing)